MGNTATAGILFAASDGPQRPKLGEIFVARGLLTPVGVERVLSLAHRTGKRFGAVLEELGLVTGDELAQALAEQYGVKVLREVHRYRFDPRLAELIPVDLAVQHSLFPLKLENGKLAVALSDPTNTRMLSNVAANNRVVVLPFISTRTDINQAIALHYLKRQSLGEVGKRVLLVDDDKLVRLSLTSTLEGEGYAVTCAEDGMDGFRQLVAAQPDVIIVDKEMPKLNGYAFFEAVRKLPETARTPVIMITSAASPEEEETAFQAGFFDFVPKPVKQATLLVKVKRAIAASALL
ncbi:MAG TPA: response regulator [Verrucomicrobiae bacterium]|nr:response regulator [Verrucomicrobiae bacterium]